MCQRRSTQSVWRTAYGSGARHTDPHLLRIDPARSVLHMRRAAHLVAALPVVHRPLTQFQQPELRTAAALIPQQPDVITDQMMDLIMATDVLVPALDPQCPAELPPTWITGVLWQ